MVFSEIAPVVASENQNQFTREHAPQTLPHPSLYMYVCMYV